MVSLANECSRVYKTTEISECMSSECSDATLRSSVRTDDFDSSTAKKATSRAVIFFFKICLGLRVVFAGEPVCKTCWHIIIKALFH